MRVTIEHREKSAGLLSRRKHCFVDCTVHFSEEERAIIKAHRLHDECIVVPPAIPVPTLAAVMTGSFAGLGPLVIVGAFIAGFAGVTFSGPIAAIGVGLTIYGVWKRWIVDRRIDQSLEPQEVAVRRLLSTPAFCVNAANPADAKLIEDEIRDSLVALKRIIENSAELQARQTFEL